MKNSNFLQIGMVGMIIGVILASVLFNSVDVQTEMDAAAYAVEDAEGFDNLAQLRGDEPFYIVWTHHIKSEFSF